MDYIGNARFGVKNPCHYLRKEEWGKAFESNGLKPLVWDEKLDLYPWPANLVFERNLHFLGCFVKIP